MSQSLSAQIDSDPEVILLTNLRVALSSMLHMLERVREDLVTLDNRIEKLTEASKRCRHLMLLTLKSAKDTQNKDANHSNEQNSPSTKKGTKNNFVGAAT